MAAVLQLETSLTTEWQQHGSCRAADSEIFFPPAVFEHKPEREAREAKAKAICSGCPVRVQCLTWALAVREPHGVWGGASEGDRKRMLLGKRAAS